MILTNLFAPFLLLAGQVLPCTACALHAIRSDTSTNATYPIITYGNDTAADAATTAWFSNHFGLSVNDLNTTIDFYSRVFGFRLLFRYQATPRYSVAYMAHASGGKNGTGYQTTAEMVAEKNNAQGLLELVSYKDPAAPSNLTSSTEVTNTFSHIGIVVPDIPAALARFEELGVNILQKPGDTPEFGGKVAKAFGMGSLTADDPEAASMIEAIKLVAGGFIYIADPDDNLIEVYSADG